MQYVKFWVRSVLLLVPATFVLLYLCAHVPLYKALIAVAIEALFGLVTVIPLVFAFARVDRAIWSDDEYAARIARKRERLAQERKVRELSEKQETGTTYSDVHKF